ncbi:MAG: helix-turn-helix domain-containing protein [Ktedonobacterales bacterium]|nr:helix-turn-helix domain-containing protein [Ktedonobacterales bacterium]
MSTPTSKLADFVSTTEASRLFGVSSTYVTKLARAGVIQASKIGRNWIIEKSSLQIYLTTPHQRGPKTSKQPHSSQGQ